MLIVQVVSLSAIVIVWEVLARNHILNPVIVSYPSAILRSLIQYLSGPAARTDLPVTGEETLLGLLIAGGIGIPLGLLMGLSRHVEAVLLPLVSFFVAAPRIAFIPIFIIWLGIGQGSKVALVALTASTPIIVSARAGVTLTDRDLLRVCKAFGGSWLQSVTKVVLPSAVPNIVAGLRLGIGYGLVGVVVGEFYAATAGVGYSIALAGSLFQTARVMALVFLAGGVGVLLSVGLGRLERHFDRWRPARGD